MVRRVGKKCSLGAWWLAGTASQARLGGDSKLKMQFASALVRHADRSRLGPSRNPAQGSKTLIKGGSQRFCNVWFALRPIQALPRKGTAARSRGSKIDVHFLKPALALRPNFVVPFSVRCNDLGRLQEPFSIPPPGAPPDGVARSRFSQGRLFGFLGSPRARVRPAALPRTQSDT
jgi:hypothetical protein